jgi:hypothetical protein
MNSKPWIAELSPDIDLPAAFAIGLTPLANREAWLAPDGDLARYLDEKDRLIAAFPDRVFAAKRDTDNAQREAAALLADHLTLRYPQTYRRAGAAISIAGTGRTVPLNASQPRLLQSAAMLVSDDLVIMRKRQQGWTLAAASLCFPTFWSLAEKFGRPITQIHAPVPGFGPGSRNALLIERIFDNLKTDVPVARSNWSIHNDGELHHGDPHGSLAYNADPEKLAGLFLRRESQTLSMLPQSGDILFTIRVHADPLGELKRFPETCSLLANRLMQLEEAGLAYKGLTQARHKLAAWLLDQAAA